MSAGKTYWWAKDATWLRRELVVELGEEFGPAGPLVLDALSGMAKLENDAGRVRSGFRAVARECFLDGPDQARKIVERAGEIGALDDLEVDEDGRRFVARVSGWQADQTKGRAAQRQSDKRAASEPDVTPNGSPEPPVTERDTSRGVTDRHAPVGDRTGQDSSSTALSPSGDRVAAVDDLDQAQVRLQSADVRAVFDAWVESTGKDPKRTRLDDKRRRRIQAGLRSHGLDDCLDAVRGWRHSPHHRGENDTATVYNDLDLLLRDSGQIEKFRDLERGSSSPSSSGDERMRRINAGLTPRGAA